MSDHRVTLFVAAMQLPGDPRESLPRLIEAGIEDLGARLVRRVLQVWDDAEGPEPVFPLLRSAGASDESASMVRDWRHPVAAANSIRPAAAAGQEPSYRIFACHRMLSPLKGEDSTPSALLMAALPDWVITTPMRPTDSYLRHAV